MWPDKQNLRDFSSANLSFKNKPKPQSHTLEPVRLKWKSRRQYLNPQTERYGCLNMMTVLNVGWGCFCGTGV
jgi:hypothetical protein